MCHREHFDVQFKKQSSCAASRFLGSLLAEICQGVFCYAGEVMKKSNSATQLWEKSLGRLLGRSDIPWDSSVDTHAPDEPSPASQDSLYEADLSLGLPLNRNNTPDSHEQAGSSSQASTGDRIAGADQVDNTVGSSSEEERMQPEASDSTVSADAQLERLLGERDGTTAANQQAIMAVSSTGQLHHDALGLTDSGDIQGERLLVDYLKGLTPGATSQLHQLRFDPKAGKASLMGSQAGEALPPRAPGQGAKSAAPALALELVAEAPMPPASRRPHDGQPEILQGGERVRPAEPPAQLLAPQASWVVLGDAPTLCISFGYLK